MHRICGRYPDGRRLLCKSVRRQVCGPVGLRWATRATGLPEPSAPAAERTEVQGFRRLPLSGPMQARVRRLGMRRPTEVQQQVLRPILEGRDVLAISRGGTGKTLAFLLPLLERAKGEGWLGSEPAVVLEPTRGLAEQAYLAANRLRDRATKVVLLHGGGGQQAMDAQRALLRRGAQLIIGTPGRVCEMARLGLISAECMRVLVVDEADEMLSTALAHDVRALLDTPPHTESSRQTLVFAGAMPPWLQEEVGGLLRHPLRVDLFRGQPIIPTDVKHYSCEIMGGLTRRTRAVAWLLEKHLGDCVPSAAAADGPGPALLGARALVFVPTRAEAVFLSTHAMLRHRSVALHGQMSQEDRATALELFRASPGAHALVTTDLAVRGLELPDVSLVIHTAPPASLETYVHRVSRAEWSGCGGRGRADARPPSPAPQSIVVYSGRMVHRLRELEKELQWHFDQLPAPSEDALRVSAVAYISRELQAAATHYDFQAFEEDATRQTGLHGPRLLAAALVLLERRRRSEEWVSPLSGRARYTPLLFVDPFLERVRSRRDVIVAIARAIRARVSGEAHGSDGRRGVAAPRAPRVGRIELTSKGYVADVPLEDVPKVLEDPGLRGRGVPVVPITQLSGVVEEQGRKGTSASRSRASRQCQRPSLAAARARRRAEFLYPMGRREPFGPWLPAGSKTAPEGAARPQLGRHRLQAEAGV